MGRFPVTAVEICAFIAANESQLKAKEGATTILLSERRCRSRVPGALSAARQHEPQDQPRLLGRQTLLAPSRPFAIVRIDGHPLLTPPPLAAHRARQLEGRAYVKLAARQSSVFSYGERVVAVVIRR